MSRARIFDIPPGLSPSELATATSDRLRRLSDEIRRLTQQTADVAARVASRGVPTIHITSDATLQPFSQVVLVDTSAGNVVVTLPPMLEWIGDEITVTKTTADANTVTVRASGSDTFNDYSNWVLTQQWDSITVKSTADGSGVIVFVTRPPAAPNVTAFSAGVIANQFVTGLDQNVAATQYVFQGDIALPADTRNLYAVEVVMQWYFGFQGDWNAGTSYNVSFASVFYGGKFYTSWGAGGIGASVNLNHQPDISPTWWVEVPPNERTVFTLRRTDKGINYFGGGGGISYWRSQPYQRPQTGTELYRAICRSLNSAGQATDPPLVQAGYVSVSPMGGTGIKPTAPNSVVITEVVRRIDPTDQTAHVDIQVVVRTSILAGAVTYFDLWLTRVFGDSTAYDYIGRYNVDTSAPSGGQNVTTVTVSRWVPENDQTWRGKAASGNIAFDASFADATTSAGITVLGLQAPLANSITGGAIAPITGDPWNDVTKEKTEGGGWYWGLPDGLLWTFTGSDPHAFKVWLEARCVDSSGNAAPPEQGGLWSIVRKIAYVPGQTVRVTEVDWWEFNPPGSVYTYMEFRLTMYNRKGVGTLQTGWAPGGANVLKVHFGAPPAGAIDGGRVNPATLGKGLTQTLGKLLAAIGDAVKFDGSDRITLDTGTGVTIAGGKVKADLGNGMTLSGNAITLNLGNGLELSGSAVQAKLGNGLTVSGGAIVASLGNGLEISGGAIQAKLGNGLTVSGGAIVANLGNGLTISGGAVAINTGVGLQVSGGALTVNLGNGLAISGSSVVVQAGNGLQLSGGAVTVNLGNGLTLSGGAMIVNATNGLNFSAGALQVNTGSGLSIISLQIAIPSNGVTNAMINSLDVSKLNAGTITVSGTGVGITVAATGLNNKSQYFASGLVVYNSGNQATIVGINLDGVGWGGAVGCYDYAGTARAAIIGYSTGYGLYINNTKVVGARGTDPGAPSFGSLADAQTWCAALRNELRTHGMI